MSLHKFAEQVAAHGRGEDSLLVHMTPDEVRKLQQFAEANGTTLTINPHTGLPEAGLLSDFFKMVAPVALGAFLGPAGMGLTLGGLSSAATAGLLTGGITTLATGSLSRGLMAGLGAYGGAGLGEGLANAGAASMGTSASLGAGIPADMAFNLADAGVEGAANVDAASKAIAQAQPSSFSKMGAGLGSITSSPEALGSFAKDNWKSLAAASAPIMAGAMVPTTTTMPENKNPAYIRQYVAGDRPQAPRALTPVLASEWGNRSFSDAYAKPMASGGIVALAAGGVPGYATGGPPVVQSDVELFKQTGDWNKAAEIRDQQNNALNQYNWQQQAEAANAANAAKLNTTAANYVASAATPNETTADFIAGANQAGIGLTAPLAGALQNSGLSAASQYALTHADIGPAENVAETYGGLKGLSNNILYDLAAYNADPRNKGKSAGEKRADALAAMNQWGLNEADVRRATGMGLNELFPTATTVTPTGVYGAYGNNTGNPMTSTSGDIGRNPDGTVTVTPNLPGRPEGGFTGMGQVKDVYTEGGGSLGYTPKAPKTIAEFNQLYNKQTGDSLAAYNYLMGKGANNNAYPTKSGVSEIMKPYEEAVLGYPTDITKKKYINVNGKMVLNPDYKPPVIKSSTSGKDAGTTTGSLTDAKTINVLNNQGQTETATLSSDGNYYTSGGDAYDVTGKPVQAKAEGGMTGYAVGGGLGSLGSYSDGGRLLKGPGDGVSDSIPATIGAKQQPARLADGEFVVPARIVSELGNGSTEAGAKKLYAMMDRVQKARGKTTGKNKVAANTRADKYLPA